MKQLLTAFCFSAIIFFIVIRFYAESASADPTQKHAEQIIQECQDTQTKDSCYEEAFTRSMKQYKLEHVLAIVSRLQQMSVLKNGCHFVAHVIAGEAVRKDPEKWQDIVTKLPVNECTGGYIMGVVEGIKTFDSTVSFDENIMEDMCLTIQQKTQKEGSDETCMHTMGHLMLIETHGNVADAISVCAKVKTYYQYECYAGVFMENEFRRNLVDHGIGKDVPWSTQTVATQQALCEKYDGLVAQACWRELSHMFVFLHKSDPYGVYKRCSAAPVEKMHDECYLHAVGVMTLSSSAKDNDLLSLCAVYTDEEKAKSCITMISNSLLGTSKSYSERVKKLCNDAAESIRESCYSNLKSKSIDS